MTKINTQFLDELENLIRKMRRAVRKKERLGKLPAKISIDVPFFKKQMEYTVMQEDKDKVLQEATDAETALKNKLKEIDKNK